MSRRKMPRVYIAGKFNRVFYWNTAVKILNEHYPNQEYGGKVLPHSWKFGPPQAARKDHMRGDTAYITGAVKNMINISYASKDDYVNKIGEPRQRSKAYMENHKTKTKLSGTIHIRDLPKDVADETMRLHQGDGKQIPVHKSPILKSYFGLD